ncbi:MAG: M20/M25/M40 family metallo-hydrolase [Acidimicrobiia bacterium]|nr:M20/M25/M40 family metallo-hydrolase [Acidimicrobiia bacterium]
MFTPGAAIEAARRYRTDHAAHILRDYAGFLSIPNVTGDVAALERNATAIVDAFTERGAPMSVTQLDGVAPIITGRLPAVEATRTLGVYVHYDGQPVDSDAWLSGPFEPVLRTAKIEQDGHTIPFPDAGGNVDPDARIYARGASDDKAPFAAILGAVDALDTAGIERHTELVFLFEGEEEAGSTHLREYMQLIGDDLHVDLWLICDGPVHPTGRPQVVFGVRGYCGFELTVYGPERELHSGHFGNWVPNPAHDLARVLATCKDDSGNVLIDGFYDSTRPVDDADRSAIADLPPVEEQYRQDLGFGGHEPPDGTYIEQLLRPTFNIRGIHAANTGAGARNVIPSQATVSVDIRLAAGNDPATMLELVADHIRALGYIVLDREPTAKERRTHRHLARFLPDVGYPASRTPVDHPAANVIAAAADAAGDGGVVRLPTFGGSVPLHHFSEVLDAPVVILPIANYDNNQHAANENLRVGNLWYGIDLWAALLAGEA